MTNDPVGPSAIWPLPKFYFEVEIDGSSMHAQEVSGLDVEAEPLEYRSGNSPVFSKVKMPGMLKSGNITLKKIVFGKDNTNTVLDWFQEIKINTIALKTVTIRLLDEGGAATMVWRLQNAFPIKISGTNLKADDVAIESIEFAHEGVKIENS